MNSIFGPAKAWFVSLPTSSPASDPEPAARSSSNSTTDHSHETANDTSLSSPKSTKPNDESSSDDDCFNTAIQDRLRQNPVQEIPKEEKVEDKEPFGGRFENMRAAHAKESKGTEDSDHATKSLQAVFPISSTKSDKPAPSDARSKNHDGTSKSNDNGSNKEANGSKGAVNFSTSQSANSTNRNGTPIASHSRESPSIIQTGSSKRPLVVADIEAWSRSESVDGAKRRRSSKGRHQTPCFDQLFSKDQRQRFKRDSGSSHSRIRAPLKPLSNNFGSFTRSGSNLDEEKSNEVAKAIRNTSTTAGVKATEKIQQIKEGAKETQKPKRTEQDVLRDLAEAPIASIFGGGPASNPADTIAASRSQTTKDTRGTQGDKNQASSQPATHRTAQATQPSLPKQKPSQPGDTITYEDHFKHIKDKYPQLKPVTIVNRLPDIQQSSKEDGRPLRTPTARKRNKPTATLASSSKHLPTTPRTNINAGPTVLPSVPAPPRPLPAPAPAPEPAPVAAIPPPPPKKAVPAQSLLSPTDVIFQYVIYRTGKHPPSDTHLTRHYRCDAYTSKKEANEKCRQRVRNLSDANPDQNCNCEYVGGTKHLFQGTITYEDGDIHLYYVQEEEHMLRDVVEKRELWLDEEGVGVYTKRRWDVWSVRHYPQEEEEANGEERVVLGMGVGVGSGSGRVEVVDEGNEGDDEDDGEQEDDLFGDRDIGGQLNEGVMGVGEGVGQESSEGSGVMAGEGVDKAGEVDASIRDNTDNFEVQTNDSQTEGRQTQTQNKLELETQQEITIDDQSQHNQTLSDKAAQQNPEDHADPQPEPHAAPNPEQQPQPQPTNTQRPPTPPLPCDLYSPIPSSTEYSSSEESSSSSSKSPSRTRRSLPNNIPPPPPPLPSSSLLDARATHHGTFTTLRRANLEVLEVFKALTKPDSARISDVFYWREEVVPEAETRFKEWSNDVKEGEGMEERPFNLEWEPDANRYKWRFRKVEVLVKELELKGPRDLGGLEVRMPPSRNSGSGSGSKTGAGSGSGSGSGTATGSSSRPAGNGNVRAETGTVKATTAPATRTGTTTTQNRALANQEQWKHERNARAVLNAKKKKRRRPTREEKGKGKAIDPVVPREGNGKGAEQVNLKEWEEELGGSADGDLSEEE